MAAKKEFYDQLQAYALGCLDAADLKSLRNYIHSGEEYSWQELGEYQNLTALLPSILKVEIPDFQLKDKVARKLYRIKDEIRAKRVTEISGASEQIYPPEQEESTTGFTEVKKFSLDKPSTIHQPEPVVEEEFIEEEPVEEETFSPEIEEAYEEEAPEVYEEEAEEEDIDEEEIKNQQEEDIIKSATEFEVVTPTRKEFLRPSHKTQIIERDKQSRVETPVPPKEEAEVPEEESFYKDEPVVESKKETAFSIKNKKRDLNIYEEEVMPVSKKTSIAIIALIILTILVIAGGIFAYFSISSDVKKYQTEVEKLNSELQGVTENSNDTKELQKMLEARDTRIVNLSGSRNSGYGKIIANLDQSRGYLQLGGMPALPGNKSYQLWINAGGNNFISLGLFNNSGAVEYYPIDFPELSNQSSIKIMLTEEPSNGSERPGGTVYLTGTL